MVVYNPKEYLGIETERHKVKEKYYWAEFELRRRLYPRTKFADENDLEQQLDHICSEYREVLLAGTLEQRDEELVDLQHSIETYFDIRARQGINIKAVRQKVIEKNANRGYYNTGGTPLEFQNR